MTPQPKAPCAPPPCSAILIIFGLFRLTTAGADTVAEVLAAELETAFFAGGLVTPLGTCAGGGFVALGDFALALVVVLAFILIPFLPWGGCCIDLQEVGPAAHLALRRIENANSKTLTLTPDISAQSSHPLP